MGASLGHRPPSTPADPQHDTGSVRDPGREGVNVVTLEPSSVGQRPQGAGKDRVRVRIVGRPDNANLAPDLIRKRRSRCERQVSLVGITAEEDAGFQEIEGRNLTVADASGLVAGIEIDEFHRAADALLSIPSRGS